jgi:hypothetical protein
MPNTPPMHQRSESTEPDLLLEEKITQCRESLQKNTTYLRDDYNETQKHLTWCVMDMGNIVVEKTKSSLLPIKQVSPAPLSAIVQITHKDFWLSSDGGWDGPTYDHPTLPDVQMSCTSGFPQHEELDQEFITVIENIDSLIVQAHRCTYTVQHFQTTSSLILDPKIRFSHRLFKVSYLSFATIYPLITTHSDPHFHIVHLRRRIDRRQRDR